MRGNVFLDKLELVDDKYLEEAEQATGKKKLSWRKYGTIAACFCLLIAGGVGISHLWREKPPMPPVTEGPMATSTVEKRDDVDVSGSVPLVQITETACPTEPVTPKEVFYYNEAAPVAIERIYIPRYFEEELKGKKLLAVLPTNEEGMEMTGKAGFDGEGSLLIVMLTVSTVTVSTGQRQTVAVTMSDVGYALSCYAAWSPFGEAETVTSQYNGVEYTLYRCAYDDGATTALEASMSVGECRFVFSLTTATEELNQAKEAFEQVLVAFSKYTDGMPDLSAVVPEEIPESMDETFSLTEAHAVSVFGEYFLRNVPQGYQQEVIRRYKDKWNDYLSGLWSKGYSDISWKVHFYTDEDASRLTKVSETERYDLALYPIPRAESVPVELQSVVDNPIFAIEELTLDAVWKRAYKVEDESDEWRMEFSVKYGDILVEVRTEGVTPEWLYEELKEF